MRMRYGKSLLLSSVLVLVSACHPDQEYVDSLPDMAGLGLEITGGASEGFSSAALTYDQDALTAEDLEQVSQAVGTVPEYLQEARNGIKELNENIRRIMDPIVTIIRNNAARAEPGQGRTWTRDVDGITYRLGIRKLAPRRFAWRVDAKPVGAEDTAYLMVMSGGIARGLEPHRGRGFLGINLNNLKEVKPDFPGQGTLFCGFAHEGESKTLSYGLRNFTPNLANRAPINAAFVGHRAMPSGATAVRLAALVNLPQAVGDVEDHRELVRLRVRWLPGVGGRGDMMATGGDIPAGTVYHGIGCWNVSEEETFKAVFRCTRTGDTTPPACERISVAGNRSTCAMDLRPATDGPETGLPEDPMNLDPEVGAPSAPMLPPADMPTGDAAPPL